METRVLVTGAAGFIGSNLCKALLQKGVKVLGIDNLDPYYSINIKLNRIVELEKYENFTFKNCDVADENELRHLLNWEQFSSIVHLAGQAGVRYSIENPKSYILNNIVGFFNMIEYARMTNLQHFIYASSSSVYGGSLDIPYKESNHINSLKSLYAVSKYTDELIAKTYTDIYGLKTTGLRFFTVYGENGRPDMFYYKLADALRNNTSVDVYNNGDLYRDFTYIDDIISGLMSIIGKSDIDKKESRIYNIGGGNIIKLNDFISMFEKIWGGEVQKNYVGMQKADVAMTYADTSKIQNDFGWKSSYTLETGLTNFIKWYKEHYGIDK